MVISYLPNPFDNSTLEQHEVIYAPITIRELVELNLEIDINRHVAVVNGAVVSWDFIPAADDDVIIMPDVSGGKSLIGGLLIAAGAVIGVLTSWTGVGLAIGGALISAGAGLIVGDLIKPPRINAPDTEANSNTYGFNGIQNSTGEGAPVPIVYGRHRVGGVVLEANVDNFAGDVSPKQLLTATIALSEGEIGGIVYKDGSPKIYINDQPLAYFGNDIWWDWRAGTNTQAPMRIAQAQRTSFNTDQTGRSIIYTVKNYGASTFELTLEANPAGVMIECLVDGAWLPMHSLPIFDTTTAIDSLGLAKQLRISSSASIKLINVSEHINTSESLAQIRHYYVIQGVRLSKGQPYIYKLNNSDLSGVRVTLTLPSLYGSNDSGDILETSVSFRFYKSKTAGTWTHCADSTVTDKSRSAVNHDVDFAIEPDCRFIKIERTTDDNDTFELANDSYIKAITEAESIEIAYNNTALLGLRIEPTDRLSGALPTISVVIDGVKIASVRNPAAARQTSANPADIAYDILTNKRYGLGRYIRPNQIDMDSLLAFADWCDEIVTYKAYDSATGTYKSVSEKRYELNLVIDSEMSAADVLTKICKSTRSLAYWHGDKLRFKIDREATPRQLFGMGNIVLDSYSESYIGLAEIPNQIEARFLDAGNNYKKQTLSAFDSSRQGEQVNSKTIDLFGVTSHSQLKRELVYALKKVRSIRRFVSFEVGIEGVISEIGDVILFSHDTPQYGYSGRVAKSGRGAGTCPAAEMHITLDKGFEAITGARHTIVFGAGSELIRHDFVATSDYIDEIVIPQAEWKTLPVAGTPYAAGLLKKEAMPLRILSARQTNKFTVLLECEEYNADVYTLSEDIIIDIPDYSSLGVGGKHLIDGQNVIPLPDDPKAGMADIPSRVTKLVSQELVAEKLGGGLVVSLRLDWAASELPIGSLSRIDNYAVLVSAELDKWEVAGSTKATTFTLHDVAIGQPLKIAIKPYTMYGVTNSSYDIINVTPTGKIPLPDAPEILYAVQNGKYVAIKWLPVTNTIIDSYELRLGSQQWTFARKMGVVKSCDIQTLAVSAGLSTYLVAAINANGEYGAVSSCQIDIYSPDANILFQHDSKACGWDGVYHHMKPVDDDLELIGESGQYTTGYIDLGELPVRSTVTVDYEIAGYLMSGLRWLDMPWPWDDERSRFPWQVRADIDCVAHGHDIAIFTQLSDDFHDVIRLAGSPESVRGIKPTVERGAKYGYGTFHQGLKRGDIATKLVYPITNPDTAAWSIYFRYACKGAMPQGVLFSGRGAGSPSTSPTNSDKSSAGACPAADFLIIARGAGKYRLVVQQHTIDLQLKHDNNAQLLFCISAEASEGENGEMQYSTYFAVGNALDGAFASATKAIELIGFEEITI